MLEIVPACFFLCFSAIYLFNHTSLNKIKWSSLVFRIGGGGFTFAFFCLLSP